MSASAQELTDRSSFVFEGAVRRVGAVTASGIEPTPGMAVVEVIKILKGPSVLSGFSGREITVQLHEHEKVHEGLRAVFFTNGLHFGDGLAVREVGRLEGHEAGVEKQVHEAMERASDDQLLERLRRAELVVSGEAVATHRHEPDGRARRRLSEHDPDWWECEIRVESVEKGKLKPAEKGEKGKASAREVVTLFAKSRDVAWYGAPKFEKGDKGVWLMQRIEVRGEPVEGLVTAHALDFQPLSQLERIRALLRRIEV
jgi:hypothetical protein